MQNASKISSTFTMPGQISEQVTIQKRHHGECLEYTETLREKILKKYSNVMHLTYRLLLNFHNLIIFPENYSILYGK